MSGDWVDAVEEAHLSLLPSFYPASSITQELEAGTEREKVVRHTGRHLGWDLSLAQVEVIYVKKVKWVIEGSEMSNVFMCVVLWVFHYGGAERL